MDLVMATNANNIDLTEAVRRDELLDSELDTVTGGSFTFGDLVGGIAKAAVPTDAPTRHWFNGG
jgi:hypothetical protein